MGFRKRLRSFKFAFKGLAFAFAEANFRIHLVCMFLVVALSVFLQLSLWEWALIAFAIGLVLVMEIFNTAVEYLVDFVSPNQHEKAGRIKDLAAAGVLVSALTALVIAILILLPKVISLFV